MSRARVGKVGGLIALLSLVLAVHLYGLMVEDHDIWLERSYRNRWAFRDVPTRRGSISDRRGVWIVRDRPGFDLTLRYATFRRRHPVGIAIHGANLRAEAEGLAVRFAYLAEAEPGERAAATDFVGAMSRLLDLPVAMLGPDGSAWPGAASMLPYAERPADIGRDLRFYAGALLAALCEVPQRGFAVDLSRAVADRQRGSVLEVAAPRCLGAVGLGDAGPDLAVLRDLLEQRMRRAVDDLEGLDLRLDLDRGDVAAGRSGGLLWRELERRRIDAGHWRVSQALPEAEREALADPDFWRDLAAQGVVIGDFSTWWRSFDAGARQRLTEAWLPRREQLEQQLTARIEALEVECQQLRDAAAAASAYAVENLRGRLREQESMLLRLQQRQSDEVLIPPTEDETVPILRNDRRERSLRRRLPYRFAAWLGLLAERLPGFAVRPSVLREQNTLAGADGLGGLQPFLGSLGAYGGGGSRSPEQLAEQVYGELFGGEFMLDDPDLPTELERSMQEGAQSTLERHFRIYGRTGRGGVEGALDDTLRGRPGLRMVERDRRAREQQMFRRFDVRPGRDVELTVDMRLQEIADRVTRPLDGAYERALVVLDAQSGDILAMSGRSMRPRFADDEPPPGGHWSTTPLFPAKSGWIGSVIKPFVTLAYLRRMAADPSLPSPRTFAPCSYRYPVGQGAGRMVLHCGGSHGDLSSDVAASLARSCNFFFFEACRHAGADLLHDALVMAGWEKPVAEKVGSPAAEQASAQSLAPYQQEVPGILRVLRGARDDSGLSAYLRMIGYSSNVATLFVARAYAGLATGRIPDVGLVADPGRGHHALAVPFADLDEVRRGLHGCVADNGTGRAIEGDLQRLGVLDIAYGKSGTARVTTRGGADDMGLDNAWFALFLGVDERASLVLVATAYMIDGGGGTVSAPMTTAFLEGVHADPELWKTYVDRGRR